MADLVFNHTRAPSGRGLNTRPSPIALFAFGRPQKTTQTLAALASNYGASESDLTIFCDGPRTDADEPKTEQVRAIAQQVPGFNTVRVVKRSENLGSAQSIRVGLNQMFDEHETAIIVEDDLTTSKHFLRFVNNALDYYAAEDRVVSVCGYSPPRITTSTETYFLPGAHCWGWGTWSRSWANAELDARKALDDLVQGGRVFEFDVAGAEPCTLLLQRAAIGERDSWLLPWMASAIVNEQLTLYPTQSLVRNDGLRASGWPANWLPLFESSLADYCPEIGTAPLITDVSVLKQVRSVLIHWRYGDSRGRLLYSRLMDLLPEKIRRALYVASVRRSLRRRDVTHYD